MKILVTGAGGYIGSVAAYLFLQEGHEVIAIDNFTTGFRGPLELLQEKFPDKIRWYQANLGGNLTEIFDAEPEIDAVVHYAANCSVNESMKEPEKYFTNNVGASNNLLKYVLKAGIKRFVFSSTCAVYGETEYLPVDEKHPLKPKNPYGASKKMAEEIIQWYGQLKDFKYVILRYFNVCGASEDGLIGDSKKPSVHLMQNAVRGALGLESFQITSPEVDTPDKTPIRDYVNVVDLNRAHLKALEYLVNGGKSEIINLGTGKGNSVMEIVHNVEEITGKKLDAGKGEPRQGEYAKIYASTEKALEVLKWKPEHSIADSVNSMVTWYTAHPEGWKE